MNGEVVRDRISPSPVSATSRIATIAPDDPKAVEVAYLAVLSRRPTPEEAAYFESVVADRNLSKADKLGDIYWALINSTEFSWNH